jgi:hypothetical protein
MTQITERESSGRFTRVSWPSSRYTTCRAVCTLAENHSRWPQSGSSLPARARERSESPKASFDIGCVREIKVPIQPPWSTYGLHQRRMSSASRDLLFGEGETDSPVGQI